MLKLPGYTNFQKINEGVKTVVYRGQKLQNQQSVIVKLLTSKYPHPIDVANLKYQYEIAKDLNIPGVVKCLGLEKHQNSFALIMEDFGGQSLNYILASLKNDRIGFLRIAIQLAATLGQLHKQQIIHKDIKPKNIIINPATWLVKIIDFSISSRLGRENQTINNPNYLEGTLAYISPEQTGRMNRSIDYRTDFYSLGATFYEMLTGSLPFAATDPMELVHCHLAKQPVPPIQLNPEIPQTVSDITLKLLAKTAEERYQTAEGLKADLENCLTQLQEFGTISPFIVGSKNLSGQLLIPQKLYGREEEVAVLMEAFERTSLGTAEMMLVSGYSGIGKSCLVNEVHKPVAAKRGYFIAGKFDQFKRNIPYASLIQAFQSLLRQLLTEDSEKIAVWKEKILTAVSQNGSLIINVIPELELIVGHQPEVPQLSSHESQNRFNRVFQQFFKVFCQPEHPLVVFLDDLQWADSASLKLIQLLMRDRDSQYLLMIGAYRDNEVNPAHPLIQTLEKIRESRAAINNITVKPLQLNHVRQLIADTLNESPEASRIKYFSELLFNKTQGNPFFLTQLLKVLDSERLLTYDTFIGIWQWDIELIQTIGIADCNIVELIAKNIQQLPASTQKVLKLAACIGSTFNLSVLAIANEESESVTASGLWPALQSGLILPLSGNYKIPLVFQQEELRELILSDSRVDYKFLHDRVQQAAYSLIPESDRKSTHLNIGKLLLQNTSPEDRKENIFALVNQLNFSTDLIVGQVEKDELAFLNLIAGQKAKTATAYEAAARYLNIGLELLAANSWQSQYELTLNLHVEAVETEFLNTNFKPSEILADAVLKEANTLLDRVKVYELKIQSYIAQNQLIKAINTGGEILEMLGVSPKLLAAGNTSVKLPSLTDLENAPEMTAPDKLAAMRLLMTISAPASIAKPEMVLPIVLTQINLCIENGHSALAAYAYSIYGLLLCAALGDLEAGYYSGQIALKLLEQFNAKELTAKVYTLFNVTIRHWKEHARETIDALQEGVQSGLDTGDVEYAGYCALNSCAHIFLIGNYLESVESRQAHYLDLLLKLKQEFGLYYIKIWRQLVLNLFRPTSDKCCLIGESFDEVEMLPILETANNQISLFAAYLAKSILSYLFKEFAAAVENASIAEKYKASAPGHMTVAVHNFYYSLALLAQYPDVRDQAESGRESEQQEALAIVELNQEKMKGWAYHTPANYQHKYDLVEAEIARVKGQSWEAMKYYDLAIAGAKKQGYVQEEALAYELAAEFYLAASREEIAQTYMASAYYSYARWGAKTKIADLESRYPPLLSLISAAKNASFEKTTSTETTTVTNNATGNSFLDLATVMKASQVLASEVVLSKLLEKLLKILMENAGAQSGLLILAKNGNLLIEASGSVEQDRIVVQQSLPIAFSQDLPLSLINYVVRTKRDVVLDDAGRDELFKNDIYIVKNNTKSILCTPIINQATLIAVLYLENNLATGVFTAERQEVLKLLSTQAAISLENAFLYKNLSAANEKLQNYSQTLEAKVQDRTREVTEKNAFLQQEISERISTESALRQSEVQLKEQAVQLENALLKLQQTQAQMIQTEKMSSLGQLVAGIAHEINNPINFIYGNLTHATEYMQYLLQIINIYQRTYPNLTPELAAVTEEIELDFLQQDLLQILKSMNVGAERIRNIVIGLRNFSRLAESEMKRVDIHEGIESTLLILQHRLNSAVKLGDGNDSGDEGGIASREIQVVKEYGNLPLVECSAGELNQVFMNILGNAIDALVQLDNQQCPTPAIRIRTEVKGTSAIVSIADNGLGMSESVRVRVFDPFFTTKPVGSGTGLGLSVSHSIIVQKHGGSLTCISAPRRGAEFVLEIPLSQGI
ncbi:trifunctional serine/threonine-protein kinase/ATP-binding protein/sensor histidine kinase [Microcoleus asticus]|uniref:histidine kinase n=1 Tax=Microcoleus asticus IPMA8 TaxID=2563858 RepID=A0ABX2CZH1_9CYAN|nr:ATP-binding sensor histidine kinase [Microcoleus asticus]NQE35800.1 Serine/threonine-protein kinase PrkC [Microcoleus asticus IPMA8]